MIYSGFFCLDVVVALLFYLVSWFLSNGKDTSWNWFYTRNFV